MKARKGVRWMPRLRKAKKDAASCEKPRGGAGDLRSADVRMGQPGGLEGRHPHCVRRQTRGTETS